MGSEGDKYKPQINILELVGTILSLNGDISVKKSLGRQTR